MTTARPIEELLFYMTTVAKQASSEWEANFARSILKQSKRPTWNPSEKQLWTMRRMVSDLFLPNGVNANDDIDLIDTGDRHDAA
jgi:hypothetical protein